MLLEARDVTKAFGSFKAVDAASVTLEQGDILGLIGPNGAGKSTLFNCLTGDLASTSGKVLFEGHDITSMTPEARAHLGLARALASGSDRSGAREAYLAFFTLWKDADPNLLPLQEARRELARLQP